MIRKEYKKMDSTAIKHIYNNGFENFYKRVTKSENIISEEEKILEAITLAHKEWKTAEIFFQNMTEEDLIDYAIYRLQASIVRYNYLIKLAKKMGVKRFYCKL